jgi:tight adherence protein C
MPENIMPSLAAFLMVSSLILLVSTLVGGRKNRVDVRLRDLAGKPDFDPDKESMAQLAYSALPTVGKALVPTDEKQRTKLQTRLIHAGLYGRQAMLFFLGVKLLLMVCPTLVGLAASALGLVTFTNGLIFGLLFGIVGLIGPGFWLDRRKAVRQTAFRRALPDALDVIVICLEGGLSLTGAIRRVSAELRTAHPLLAHELAIAQREVQLGRSTGEALRAFAERADLEELRSLASVIIQTERFGASLVKALRVHAETLRTRRLQQAEEMAQKAAIKVLFPTILFIFPGMFIVVLGPAVIHIANIFARMQQ